MRILCWNMNYWNNTKGKLETVIEWKNKCIEYLKIEYLKNEKNIDFYLLQEINPFKLFERLPNQYFFSMPDYNILYHELKSELLFDGRNDNFWGNAILFNKNISVVENNMDIKGTYYYGRNAIMYYDFILPNKKNITIINIYNKINHAYYSKYTMLEYLKNDSIIQKIMKSNGNIILAGDFNTFFKKDKDIIDFEKELEPLTNCAKDTDFWKTHTYYHAKDNTGIDDFCFASTNIKIDKINIPYKEWNNDQDKNHRWNGLSDHCPIIVDFDF